MFGKDLGVLWFYKVDGQLWQSKFDLVRPVERFFPKKKTFFLSHRLFDRVIITNIKNQYYLIAYQFSKRTFAHFPMHIDGVYIYHVGSFDYFLQ